MELSDSLKQYLTSELRNVASKMSSEDPNSGTLAYWYSAAFGAVQRVLNIEYDRELVFIYGVLLHTHSNIAHPQSRANQVEIDGQSLFLYLGGLLAQLAESIDSNAEYTELLVSISAAAYMATGNGYYLWSGDPMNHKK